MAIWLKNARSAIGELDVNGVIARVGAAADVIPRDVFGALVSIDQAYVELAAERATILDAAHIEAARIVEEGYAQAQQTVDEARREYATAVERGYQDGHNKALVDWMDRLTDVADAQEKLQYSMRERLAGIVALAVEKIVRVERHEALVEQALTTVDRIVNGATYLRAIVHPDEYEEAKTTFERCTASWRELGRRISLSVVADKRLEPGSCVFESDFGTVDASLDTQLRAMRSAVSRALKHSIENTDGIADDCGMDEAGDAANNAFDSAYGKKDEASNCAVAVSFAEEKGGA